MYRLEEGEVDTRDPMIGGTQLQKGDDPVPKNT